MNWWQYLLLVNIYLVLFYGFYALLLRKETFFQLNRAYLVSSAMLSFFIPLIQAGWVQQMFITQKVKYTIYSNAVVIHNFKPIESAGVNFGELFAYLYLAGIVFLVTRLIIQLTSLNKIISMPEKGAAYSFFRKIKLDMEFNANDAISAHEQVHAKQWHSADVMIMEAVMIINWFNPVVYFYRRAIKHIHEFIADSRAVNIAANKSDYALLLLSRTFNAPQHSLVNNFFNGSLLKQRIIMLQKNKSQRISLLKYGLSAPLFMLMLILSSATVNNSKPVKIINKKAAQVFETPATVNAVLTSPSNTVTTAAITTTHINARPKKAISIVAQKDTVPSGEQVFSAVEQYPQFIGGQAKLMEFLANNIKYPADMRQHNIQGKVIVSFIVEKDGSVSNIKALKSPDPEASDEAVRVMGLTSSKWIPGLQNHQYVRVQYVLPIVFALGDSSTGLTTTSNDTTRKVSGLTYTKKDIEALIILNGKEIDYNTFKLLDANSIESISILKDKSAIALYGTKGAHGVIIIKTKW